MILLSINLFRLLETASHLHENCVLPMGNVLCICSRFTHAYGSKFPAGMHCVIKVGPKVNPHWTIEMGNSLKEKKYELLHQISVGKC